MAYADDINIFSTNAKGLQCLIDMCTMYSDRWRFKYGIEKSKCMIIVKSHFTCEPLWRLNDVSLRNVETIEIIGNVLNSKSNNTSHVDNRLNKCRQSFYGLNSLGMSYPGAAPEVQAHLYKSTSWLPGFARDPRSPPSLPFVPPFCLPPSDYPASARIFAVSSLKIT